jgi:hypothetical protein
VSAGVALKLRGEREIPRVQPLFELSRLATNGMYISFFVLLAGGVAAAFIAALWGRGWIWAAIALLVLMFVAMYARASPWFRDLRRLPDSPARRGEEPSRRKSLTPRGSRHSPRRAGRWRSRLSATAGCW